MITIPHPSHVSIFFVHTDEIKRVAIFIIFLRFLQGNYFSGFIPNELGNLSALLNL